MFNPKCFWGQFVKTSKRHKLQSFALLPLYKQLVPDDSTDQILQTLLENLFSAHDKLDPDTTCLQE